MIIQRYYSLFNLLQVQLGLIQTLTLQNASLVMLPSNFLKGLYVKKLDLSLNVITDVHQQAFAGLESILQVGV